jgi:glycosyltransferase involved in cell wall biosynthesis
VRHIAHQAVPRYVPWEFVLIDNGSTDGSADVARSVWTSLEPSGDFRVVNEPVLGLSHARARGFAAAKYEFVIMCDDDNWIADNYLATAYEIMIGNPRIAALGGLGKLVFETEPPEWIKYTRIFAAGEQAERSGKVKQNRIYGAGCVIRRSAYFRLKELGFRSFLIDRKGTELSSGGDHELCYALSIMGYDIWYDERLRFFHFITKDRLTWQYLMRYAHESSRCFDVLTSYKMIAADSSTYKFSFITMARDFFFCLRQFIRVNSRRLITAPQSVPGKILYFRHVILMCKLVAYFSKFNDIVRNHEEILQFKEACVEAQMIKRATPQLAGRFRFTFSLRLFRLLQ